MKRISIVVSGRVQGVGFRYFAQEIADQFSISGWVRNASSGDVEIEAQGEDEHLTEFTDRIKEGPALSYVSDFTCTEMPVIYDEKEFQVRY